MKKSSKFLAVAIAAIMTIGSIAFISCTKENDPTNPNAITEANLVGEWGWPSNHEMKGSKIILNADHTGGGMPMSKFNWTLDGNKFVGLSVYGGYRLEMTIKSINGDKMEVEGQHQLIDNDGNVIRVEHTATGTLVKTITTQSPTLTTDLMVGTWNFDADDHLLRWDMTVNSDGTCVDNGSNCTWTINGSEFNWVHETLNESFTAESMTSTAMKITLHGTYVTSHGSTYHGTLTKNL